MSKNINISPRQTKLIVWTLLSIMPIIGMIVDLIAPSLPAISNDLHVTEGVAKNIITCFVVGFAIGNFFTGFLADALGRQKLIRIALFGFILVSILPIIYPKISIVLVARLLQGITSGAAAVLLRSIFSDILPKEKLVPLGTVIGMMWGLGPVFGPVIGGYLQYYFGWKSCFYFFAGISSLSFMATYFIVPETHFNRHPLKFSIIKKNIFEVISNPVFIGLPLIMGISYSLIIAFHSSAPFLIQVILHHSPVYFGRLALFMGISFLIATMLAKFLLTKYSINQILKSLLVVIIILQLIAVIISIFTNNSLVLMIMSSLIMFFASGIIYPLSMGKGLSMFSHIAGTATAIMYLLNGAVTGISSYIMSFVVVKNVTAFMEIYLILLFICSFIFLSLIYRKSS